MFDIKIDYSNVTVNQVFNSFTDEDKQFLYWVIGNIVEEREKVEYKDSLKYKRLSDVQQYVFDFIVTAAIVQTIKEVSLNENV